MYVVIMTERSTIAMTARSRGMDATASRGRSSQAARRRFAGLLPASPLGSWLDRGEQPLYAVRAALDDGLIGYGQVIARAKGSSSVGLRS
jgi:hypothetical protein